MGKLYGRMGLGIGRHRKRLSGPQAVALCEALEAFKLGGFWSTDAHGLITYLSPSCAALTGEGSAIGQPFTDLFKSLDSRNGHGERALPFLMARRVRFVEHGVAAARMEGRWWRVSGEPAFDRAGAFIGFNGVLADVTRDRVMSAEQSDLALRDPLTGLMNRRHMTELLERTLVAGRAQQRSCAIMLIDLDRFKHVNDTLGHQAGDALLKLVAGRLQHVVGDQENVCRLGGDEFQIMLTDTADRGELGALADRIIANLSAPYSVDGQRCIIGASVGIAVAPFDGATGEDLTRNADLALYGAKRDGKGRFRFYSKELLEAAQLRKALEDDLHDALPNNEFELVYQPIVEAGSNQVTGVESLLRWNHPVRGPISPAQFIPIAEESSRIKELGSWALARACADAALWPVPLRVAVNVSPVQFDDDLPQIVAAALADSGLPASRLELEITEGVFMAEGPATDRVFAALKALGVRIALDDFGTGYSSLGYLQRAPFDKIKIDQSFVRNALEGDRTRAIIGAIVAVGTILGLETTAEGVESFDQLAMLRDLQVSHIQGYLFSRPLPHDALIAALDGDGWVLSPSGPAKQRRDRHTMFRQVVVVHEDHCYPATLRNLSASGALIEGIMNVPVGTRLVVNFGEGQLATSTVRRSRGALQGVQFDDELVHDGNGGLCTRHRVHARELIAARIPIDLAQFLNEQSRRLSAGEIGLPAFTLAGERSEAILRVAAA